MRDVLEALADGDCSVAEAEAALAGYATAADGRFDAACRERTGVPEAVLASGKTPSEIASLAAVALETTGHALVVAAGREGALPTVVAGLVDVPVIGLPVSVGYGAGGDGEAALLGMLQSCSALTVVNVDNGFTAGAQAGLVATALDAARDDDRHRGD